MAMVQGITITGTVTDNFGDPLPGVNVVVKGTSTGQVTDANGRYSITVSNQDAVLLFSFIGYTTVESVVGNQTSINIQLSEDASQLEEVVVIGYGVQKKTNLTGSVTVVDAEKLDNRPITNSTQALQGLPGIYVNQAGGRPGDDAASIRIRGVGTIGSAGKLDPLVLVDGVEYPLGDVNPNDIASISVLKDAASTAIYGSRSANGVILVTTKLGNRERSSIEYSNYFGVQRATYLPNTVSNSVDFMENWNQARLNEGDAIIYSQAQIDEYINKPANSAIPGISVDQVYPNTDWMDVTFRSAFLQEHNLRFSGGSEKTRYNLSAGYLDQEGVAIGTASKRYNGSMRVNTDVNNRITIEGGVIVNRWDIDHPNIGAADYMNRIFRMVPLQPAGRLPDGRWPSTHSTIPSQNSFQSPQMFSEETYMKQLIDRLMLNFNLKLKLFEGLTYDLRASLSERQFRQKAWNPAFTMVNTKTGGDGWIWASVASASDNRYRDERMNVTNLLTYQKAFGGDHSVLALLGSSMEKYQYNNLNASKNDFPSNDMQEMSVATVMTGITGTSVEDVLVSYFGRIQYAYQDKYLLEVNGRYDGSSRFADENRWGFFPSFSAGWRISEESFMKDIAWLDALKIRISYGHIGNQEIGRFQFLNSVNIASLGYPFGGVYQGGATYTQMKDPKISWETTKMTNFGLEWRLFNGMLTGEFDVFKKRTDGILRQVALPAQVGALTGPTTNIAVVDNSGFEITLYHNNRIGDFSYQIGGTLTKIKNNVVDLKGEIIYSGLRITKEGEAIDSWYVYQTDGLYRTQADLDNPKYPRITPRVGLGDVKYVDRSKDGEISGDDRYIAGNSFPEYTYGFTIGASYKNLSLTTVWQGVQNISLTLRGNMSLPYNNGAGLTKEWLTDAWTPQNPNARLPRITSYSTYNVENFSPSDYWLEDASYLRLKNIQLAYDLPNWEFLNKAGIKKLKLFVNGQNLLTISKMKTFDPEQDVSVENLNKYPSVKMVTGGLNISF